MTSKWRPIKVIEIELSQEIKSVRGLEGYGGLYILARYQGQPISWAYLDNLSQAVVPAAQLREVIDKQVGWALVPLILTEQVKANQVNHDTLQPISIIVYTRKETDRLKDSLQALLALDYPTYEIIIVSNEPFKDRPAQSTAQVLVRYVYEPQPGLDRARNRGLREANYNIVAFIGETAYPDHNWLKAINRAFIRSDVMAVTGLVAPAELETVAQMYFYFDYPWFNRGLRRQIIRREALTNSIERDQPGKFRQWLWRGSLTNQELLWTNSFGSGVNMAFRRDLFTAIGLFDTALGVGTHSKGSGDIELFHRLVMQGYTLVYEHEALVWDTQPRDDTSLRQLVYDNGRAFGAYLLTCIRNRTLSGWAILFFIISQWLGRWFLYRLIWPGTFPRHLVAVELAGALLSPFAYLVARVRPN